MPYPRGMEPGTVLDIALAFWPLWVSFAVVWVTARIEGGKSMLGIIVCLCVAVLFVAPLAYALGKLNGAPVVALVLAAFAALGLVAMQ